MEKVTTKDGVTTDIDIVAFLNGIYPNSVVSGQLTYLPERKRDIFIVTPTKGREIRFSIDDFCDEAKDIDDFKRLVKLVFDEQWTGRELENFFD